MTIALTHTRRREPTNGYRPGQKGTAITSLPFSRPYDEAMDEQLHRDSQS
jgi:hypothetical protein